MSDLVTATNLVAALLVLGALAGVWRDLRRERPWPRRLARAALQLLAAGLFGCLLFPPPMAWHGDALTVLSGGDVSSRPMLPFAQTALALPEAAAPPRIARVPDLATARREHPALRRLDVVGEGLTPRDLPAAAGLHVTFAALPAHGLIELQAPQHVRVGQAWTVQGRLAAPAVQIELHDPAGVVVDRATADAQGHFRLAASAAVAGRLGYELRSFDAQQNRIDSTAVPVIAEGGVALNMLLRAGAPGPELKYWRRWAHDAGVTLASTVGISDGLQIHDGDATFSADALAHADLVIVDERAWPTLTAGERAALLAAVEHGLGLLLRVGGPIDAPVLDDWRGLGLRLEPQDELRSVALPSPFATDAAASFTAAALKIGGDKTLLSDAGGAPLVVAVDHGAGRIAVTTLLDSYQLQLTGASGRYGAWWAQLIGEIARPRPRAPQTGWPEPAWTGERVALCEVADGAVARAPSGARTALLRDGDCAAYWPREAGWHRLEDGTGGVRDFYVRADDDAVNLRRQRDRDATLVLTKQAAPAMSAPTPADARVPMPRWPWLLAWLLAMTLLWWRERPSLAGVRR